ncbi:unnamed protein product [Notodromas monacha]|uniref:Prefoldin subunit 2 n=1 Tax=Notodromas monacha TaxID=399045 RepID=A0A7R9GAP5_9CRUS|nr:unnamed protein product [Notodromas monacha]CAG0915639.1 unnamed protein product [Notodromas monacha]
MAETLKAKPQANKKMTEEIIGGFNALRAEQRRLTQKITELESERAEHNLVINTLKDVDPARRCYRLIGGILVERNVGQVLPALQNNVEQIDKVVEALNKQAVLKGQELVDYKEKHNIRLSGLPQRDDSKNEAEGPTDEKSAPESTGVLVDSAASK